MLRPPSDVQRQAADLMPDYCRGGGCGAGGGAAGGRRGPSAGSSTTECLSRLISMLALATMPAILTTSNKAQIAVVVVAAVDNT